MFNRHKIKRKLGKRIKKTKKHLSSEKRVFRSERDFAYKFRKTNPHFEKGISWYRKVKFQLSVVLVCVIGIIGTIFYHPFFQLKHIHIEGLQRIQEDDILAAIRGITDSHFFIFLSRGTYFGFHEIEVEQILSERYALREVIVKKEFPNTVSIAVEEKISTLIYDNGKKYTYVGSDGKVTEVLKLVEESEWIIEKKIVTSTDEFGDEITSEEIVSREHIPSASMLQKEFGEYPVVYDMRGEESIINEMVLSTESVNQILQWHHYLKFDSDISYVYLILENSLGDASIKTGEGWSLRVRLSNPMDEQILNLESVLDQDISRDSLQYIDLRFLDKVYWM
ncbi:MAG: FtsQ-type POTRA domain-containing protein [Candidatus Magasanikbacteria bacterium]